MSQSGHIHAKKCQSLNSQFFLLDLDIQTEGAKKMQ